MCGIVFPETAKIHTVTITISAITEGKLSLRFSALNHFSGEAHFNSPTTTNKIKIGTTEVKISTAIGFTFCQNVANISLISPAAAKELLERSKTDQM
ncbi:hypothetical protein EMIT0P395_30183 [Pseudomonas sp. IT-P395]